MPRSALCSKIPGGEGSVGFLHGAWLLFALLVFVATVATAVAQRDFRHAAAQPGANVSL